MDTIDKKPDANRDPITGAPGAHPVGVGVGAAAGGMAAGAAAGTLTAGPIGTVLGAAIGAVVGGLGGKAVAEHFDPTVEEAFWKENHAKQPYYKAGEEYDQYAPAYKLGYEGRAAGTANTFEEAEPALKDRYASMEAGSFAPWDRAKQATKAAWNRVGGDR